MAPTVLYIVCLIGALGLYLMVRGHARTPVRARQRKALGAILCLGVFGYLVAGAAEAVGPVVGSSRPEAFYVVFSVIALASAVMMITSSRPVYSALYFVLVVLASAGLFLLLEAEFMAFALIIVYAGAILITYMFVLMLAQQAPTADTETGQPEYDLNPREPAAGALVGFVLLALLARMVLIGPEGVVPPAATPVEAQRAAWVELQQMPGRLESIIREREGSDGFELGWGKGSSIVTVAVDGTAGSVRYTLADGSQRTLELDADALPENVQRVGLGLISRFHVSLELAGVILLMAMFGAVVLARRQIELTEDETRQAAGLRPYAHHEESEGGADR